MSFNPPDVKSLRRLRPLAMFNEEQLQSLANQLQVATAYKSDVLIKLGSTEKFSLFVLEGEITLKARDGKEKTVSYSANEELNPVAQLRPSLYEVCANGPVRYLKIDTHKLTEFANLTESGGEDISLQIIEGASEDNPLTMSLFQDLMTDSIKVPSLPEVAQKIQQIYRDENVDADKVASILVLDPAIASKIIRIANSPVYAGLAATETLQAAIVRLGMDATYKQVMAYAVNELFRSKSSSITQRMKHLWSHSRKVAAISRVLAKNTKVADPEQALLAGLTHDLGVIVIVEYLQMHAAEDVTQAQIDEAIDSMRGQITGMLMQRWNFSEEIVKVAEDCENWFRNPQGDADLCDLVMVAQYHALMGTDLIANMPPITTVPAMAKLKLGPAESMELIKQSNEEIKEIERLLL